jgi:ubiquitin-protein ligase
MENPRIKRLQGDYQKLRELEISSSMVCIEQTFGQPPHKYVIRLACKGITGLDGNEQPIYGHTHLLAVELHNDYPRRPPLVNMLTPIWHPNVGNGPGGWVCIGDDGDHGWSPSMRLDDLIVRIIEIIRYENYHPGSPANPFAAGWAGRQPESMFPLETAQIRGADIIGAIELLDDDELDIEIW